MSLTQQISLIVYIVLWGVLITSFKKAWVSLDECNYMPADSLDEYLKMTRFSLYAELQAAGSDWSMAEIFMRDSGLTILPCDGVIETRQKLLDYYIKKDAK